MSHTYISQYVHCVFSTKNRLDRIPDDIRAELWAYIGGIARTNYSKAIAVGGTANHVHVLLSLPATVTIARMIQMIKGGSSKWLHDKIGKEFAWQDLWGLYDWRFAA